MTVDPLPIGICSSASDTAAYLENITVTIVGSQIQVVGVNGSQVDPWTGLLDGNDITFSGSKVDGVGITTATFMLTYDPAMERLDGSESWDWVSGSGSCIGGTSIVTSIR